MEGTRNRTSAREHLLEVAGRLFYREGIHSVGVDRVIREAGTTRSTLYRHFEGKEGLVVAYLKREDQLLRSAFADAEGRATDPEQLLSLAITGVADDAVRHHTRGCPFINATAEFPDAESPVRQVVYSHRQWFRTALEQYLDAAGRTEVKAKADLMVMLRDAVLIGSYLDDASQVRQAYEIAARAAAGPV